MGRDSKSAVFSHDVCVEFEDVDSYGIVHHSRLVNYLERARLHFFHSKGLSIESLPYSLIVYKMDCRFIKPALLLDRLLVEVTDVEFSGFHIAVRQAIFRGNDTILKAKVVHALVRGSTGEVVPVPDDFFQKAISSVHENQRTA